MTLKDLKDKVVDEMDDPSLAGRVAPLANQALLAIAGRIKLQRLDATSTVTTATDAAYVALPTDYHRDLYWVGSGGQDTAVRGLYKSFSSFLRRWPDPALDEAGDITSCAVKGSNLYYQPIPASADTLTLHYYKLPETLSDETDSVVCLPPHLIEPLLVNYCCMKLWASLEQDVDSRKTQTTYYNVMFSETMQMLKEFEPQHAYPQYVPDERDSVYG